MHNDNKSEKWDANLHYCSQVKRWKPDLTLLSAQIHQKMNTDALPGVQYGDDP